MDTATEPGLDEFWQGLLLDTTPKVRVPLFLSIIRIIVAARRSRPRPSLRWFSIPTRIPWRKMMPRCHRIKLWFVDFESVLFLNNIYLLAIMFWLFWPVALHQSLYWAFLDYSQSPLVCQIYKCRLGIELKIGQKQQHHTEADILLLYK